MRRRTTLLGLFLVTAAPVAAQPAQASALPHNLVAPARVAMNFGVITSAFRSFAHNRRVGGVANSHHLYGRALDVARRRGISHRMVEEALRRAGFRLIESLDEGDHSHFAFATPGTAPPLVLAAAPASRTAPVPAPPKPLPSPLLADHHGTLLVATAQLAREAPAPAVLAAGSQ